MPHQCPGQLGPLFVIVVGPTPYHTEILCGTYPLGREGVVGGEDIVL